MFEEKSSCTLWYGEIELKQKGKEEGGERERERERKRERRRIRRRKGDKDTI